MRERLKLLSLMLAVVIVFSVSLVGCGSDMPQDESSVALVIGAHDYNPKFTVPKELSEVLDSAICSCGNISVTVVSGEPVTIANWSIEAVEEDVGEEKLMQIAEANRNVIVERISQAKAESAEVDTLSAIQQGANNLAQTDSPIKTLVIFDYGISTTGYLDFTQPKLIVSDPESIVSQLVERNAIPDLSDMHVIWYGLGQARGDQPKLNSNNRERLKALWDAILRAGNPASLKFYDGELTQECVQGDLPEVSIVDYPSDEIDLTAAEPANNIFLQLTDEKLSFLPDSSEFSNAQEVSDTLDSVASVLNKSNISGIYVIGSTATAGPHDTSMILSEQRAEKVKAELIDRGVSITIYSAGIGDLPCSLRTDDVDSGGKLIEEQAKQNRAVFVISENSASVRNLINEGII